MTFTFTTPDEDTLDIEGEDLEDAALELLSQLGYTLLDDDDDDEG